MIRKALGSAGHTTRLAVVDMDVEAAIVCSVDEDDHVTCSAGSTTTSTSPHAILLTGPVLGRAELLPPWFVPTPYVHSGYRLQHHSVGACLRSVFTLHNDTLNIWTHLAAFGAWAQLAGAALGGPVFGAQPWSSQCVGAAALVLGSALPLFSALAHTLHPVSQAWYLWAWRLDYTGILCGWFARYVFVSWFLFGCDNYYGSLRPWLVGVGCLLFGSLSGPVVFRRDMRLFGLLYLALHLPELVWWWCRVHVPVTLNDGQAAVEALAVEGVRSFMHASLCGVLGALFFFTYIPERWMPGRLDLLPNSHVIWHLWTGFGPALLCVPATQLFMEFTLGMCGAGEQTTAQ